MAKPESPSLPYWMMLILVICLFSLAAHFFTEQAVMSSLTSTAIEISGHGEDHFVVVLLALIPAVGLLIKMAAEPQIPSRSLSLSPVLPPPNK